MIRGGGRVPAGGMRRRVHFGGAWKTKWRISRVLEGRVIVCIASSWDYDPTSKHHIMKLLSRSNDVVWVNYHGTRRPRLTPADLRAALRTAFNVLRGTRRVSDSFVQITPLVIPGASNGLLRRVHEKLVASQIRRAVAAVDPGGARPVQVWSFAPDVPHLVGELAEECFVYYCVDEHTQFAGVNAERIAEAEDQLTRRADLVITSSKPLFDSRRTIRPDAVLMRHGVDFDHFASAWRRELPVPEDLAAIPAPRLGFFGVLHYWIDVNLIAAVAGLRPDYSFVLIGEKLADVSVLEQLPNVFLLGRRPNAVLPAYCAHFCAGLMPFKQTALTHYINPIKMAEYLAAGLPAVSTPVPEARRYDGPVTIAETAEAFAAACDKCVSSDRPERREEISGVVRNDSWLSRVERLSDLIEERVLRHEPPSVVGEPARRSCAGVL